MVLKEVLNISTIGYIILIASLLASAIQTYDELTTEQKEVLKQLAKNSPGYTTTNFATLLFSLEVTTPAKNIEWIGDPNNKIPLLEEIPLYDAKDTIPIALWLLLGTFIVPLFWKKSLATGILTALAWIILGTIIIWAAWKLALINVYDNSAMNLSNCTEEGTPKITEIPCDQGIYEQLINTRKEMIERSQKTGTYKWFVIPMIAGSLLILKRTLKLRRKRG